MVYTKKWFSSHNDDIVQTYKSSGFCFDLESSVKVGGFNDSKDRLMSLFDEVLSVFLREVSGKNCILPIPALLGDGRSVDLFKLFWVVRKGGGFDSVSNNGLWAFVAEECALDIGVVASLKLIYLKYLDELDQWLWSVFRKKSLGKGDSEVVGKLDLLSLELEAKFRVLLSNGQQLKNKDSEIIESESNKNSECIDLDNDKSEVVNLLAAGNTNKVHENAERIINDDDEKVCVNNDNNVVGSDTSIANEALNSGKRKRESLFSSGMLNCVRQVAKHSDDPAIRTIPECSKWKKRESEEIWPKVLLAQEALLIRKHVDSHTEESRLQKQLKRHASIFEDNDVLNHKSTEGLRCSERFPSLTKSHLSRSCNSCSVTQSKLVSPRKAEVENSPKEQALLTVDILATNTTDGMSEDEALQKHVPVGPLFQAEVPKWTGVVSKSDSKWLGIQIWPQEDVKHNSFIEMDPIGKGRQDSCGCRLPGSVDCVRFHIAEKRMKLKLELGSVFYRWRFDRMGEEVSLSWTIDEEKKFKNMVRSKPPSLNKCFWDNVFKFFPTKTREKLVSYYFNVFLIRQRSYQNRVTPKNIDSDDEESEFGCVGDGFGYEAVKIPGSKLLCVLNEQYTELA